MDTYRITKPYSKKKRIISYGVFVIISLILPFIPIYKGLGWGRLVLYDKELFELYNPILVVSSVILWFHILLPCLGIFFLSIFTDKTEVDFEGDTIIIFDKNNGLTTINHNQIIDIISDKKSLEIFYDNTSIKLKYTKWTWSNDFDEVLKRLNDIKLSKINHHNENQKVFEGKAILFKNSLYYILSIIGMIIISISFISLTYNIVENSEFTLFFKRVLLIGQRIIAFQFALILMGLIYLLYRMLLETLIFDFKNPNELEIKRKNETLIINPKDVKSTSIIINPILKSYSLSVNWGLKVQFIKLENPCFVDRYKELFSNFEKTENKELSNGTIIKFVSREC